MKFNLSILFLCIVGFSALAQESIVPIPLDSNKVKELFFAGLKEKMTENYVKAGTNFAKIIALDPKNDAAYFELATLNFRQHKLLDAEILIKKAISLNGKNTWYLKLQSEIYKRNGNMDALVVVFDQLIQHAPYPSEITAGVISLASLRSSPL